VVPNLFSPSLGKFLKIPLPANLILKSIKIRVWVKLVHSRVKVSATSRAREGNAKLVRLGKAITRLPLFNYFYHETA
jgi:hypothetical protein